jgi:hypothetical protein
MINLYSHIYPQLIDQACNTCIFDANLNVASGQIVPVKVQASICNDDNLSVDAKDGTGNVIWQKEINIHCEPEDCPFEDLTGLECSNG